MTVEDIEAIADRVAQKLAAQPLRNGFVLTRAEAKVYVGRASDDAFDAWRKRAGIEACAHGRYARRSLDRALEREARVRA